MESFSTDWHPTIGSKIDVEPSVNVTKFGDGYELRTAEGINSVKDQWSLTFEGSYDYINAIEAFLRARGGVEAFKWVTPDHHIGNSLDRWSNNGIVLEEHHQIVVVCRKWSRTRNQGYQQLTCTFEQVFEY